MWCPTIVKTTISERPLADAPALAGTIDRVNGSRMNMTFPQKTTGTEAARSGNEPEGRETAASEDEKAARRRREAEREYDRKESDALDEALDESFPASDPPAMTAPHHFKGGEKA
jgi:hypothetical protein